MAEQSERWFKKPPWQSSVKGRWPHDQGKPSESLKPSGIRSSSSSETQDGSSSETVVPQIETQPSTTQPFVGREPSTTQPPVQVTTTYMQPSKSKPVVLKSKEHSSSHAEELARSRVEVTKLTAEVEQLCREKDEVLGELAAHKFTAQTFQEDFEQERKDREKAHSQVAEIEERYQHQLQGMVTQLNLTSQDLQKHKETLATTENLLHSQIEQLSDRLSEKDQQLLSIAKENDRLQEEVLSKTQQVKQYKKQVDQYKEEVGALKHVAEIHMKQVDGFAKESQEWQSRAAEWQARHDALEAEVRRERSRREAFERKIADLEKLNDQLQQDRPSFPGKVETQALSRVKASAPMHRAHSSNEAKLSERLSEKDRQLEIVAAENDRLQEEVLSKTQQVKQYKRQVDQYKEEGIEKFAKETEEWQSSAAEWQARHDALEAEVRRERSRREAFEREIADLEKSNDQLQQHRPRENEQLKQQVSSLTEQIQRYARLLRSQRAHESDFWKVPRNEISLNMHKILGIGAWGFVVEGVFRGQKVAVKCLHDLIRQPEVIETIRKEICIMAQIRHPNMVMLIAAVVDAENDPLIVTELLDVSLRKAYEKHLLHGSSKLSIFRDVASALNYLHLHQQGEIIHRDVSSANVLLEAKPNKQWRAKLSDFGSAKLAIEAKTTGPGAPTYTAPEVRKEMGIRQTAKLDVYSYGVLLCEVTVEQFPMDGSLPSMMQVVRSKWPFMHGLVTSCIQEHPDNRPTMSYVLGEFDKLRPKE